MKRRLLLLQALLLVASLRAEPETLEINSANLAQLESLPGIGPALAERMLTARASAPFKDWTDLRQRVRGLGPASLRRLSAQGLRVAGQAYEATQAPQG